MKNIIMLILALLMCDATFANNKTSLVYIASKDHEKDPHLFFQHTMIDTHSGHLLRNESQEQKTMSISSYNENMNSTYNLMQYFNIPVRAELLVNLEENTTINESTTFYNTLFSQSNQDRNKRLHAIMLNAYYDFYNDSDFTPYVSLGIGAGVIKFHHQTRFLGSTPSNDTLFDLLKNNNSHLVYALGLGSSYFITPQWSADIGAKYFYGGNIEDYNKKLTTPSSRKMPVNSLDVAFGMTYRF